MTSTSESLLNIKDIVESEFLISVNYSFKGTFSGLRQFLATESPLKMKNDEKCFSFPLKISFCPQDLCLCLNYLVVYQNGLVRKIRLFSNFMTSQPG